MPNLKFYEIERSSPDDPEWKPIRTFDNHSDTDALSIVADFRNRYPMKKFRLVKIIRRIVKED